MYVHALVVCTLALYKLWSEFRLEGVDNVMQGYVVITVIIDV